MLRKTPVALGAAAFLSAALPTFALAQQAAADDKTVTSLGEITVSTTRTERKTDTVPNTVTVYTARDLQARDPRDLKDLLDGEVDLAVRATATRFTAAGSPAGRAGDEGINIRGLEGNQVLMMVDGIRLPQGFSFGAFSSGRADSLNMASLVSAEVLRGPASAQFGSDGLAGALSLTTLSPDDLLKNGKTFAGFASTSYATVDDSARLSAAVAGAAGDWQGLLLVTAQRSHESANMGTVETANTSRTAPNPMEARGNSVLAKAGLKINAQHRLLATLEAVDRKSDIDALNARAVTFSTATPTAVVALLAHDKVERQRLSLEHRYEDLNATWLQSAKTIVYAQNSETRQLSLEDRYISPDRVRDGLYREELIGLSTQAQTQLASQRLSYGLDISRNKIEGLRDGTVPPAGETFPNKPFPDTDYTLAGAYLQSEIETGPLSLIPALRFESYSLKPKAAGYGGAPVSLSDQAVTPRLGAIWRVSPEFQPYAQWALGFRAPTPDQVNNAFSNPAQGYTSVGNAHLKAEHANSFEIGLRGKVPANAIHGLRWQLSAYDNRYRDFISQEIVSGTGAPGNPLVFQYINLAQARIRGAEARLIWNPSSGWTLNAAYASSRGYSTKNGVATPLDTIQPVRVTVGTRFETGPWTFNAQWQHANAKRPGTASLPSYFLTPSFDTVDVGGSYSITPKLRVSALITNLVDSKYWRWSDVRGVAANSTVIDNYTAPGRQVQLSLHADF